MSWQMIVNNDSIQSRHTTDTPNRSFAVSLQPATGGRLREGRPDGPTGGISAGQSCGHTSVPHPGTGGGQEGQRRLMTDEEAG